MTRILAGLFLPLGSTEVWHAEPPRPAAWATAIWSWGLVAWRSEGSAGEVAALGGEPALLAVSSPVDLMMATGLAIGAGGGGGNIELG